MPPTLAGQPETDLALAFRLRCNLRLKQKSGAQRADECHVSSVLDCRCLSTFPRIKVLIQRTHPPAIRHFRFNHTEIAAQKYYLEGKTVDMYVFLCPYLVSPLLPGRLAETGIDSHLVSHAWKANCRKA